MAVTLYGNGSLWQWLSMAIALYGNGNAIALYDNGNGSLWQWPSMSMGLYGNGSLWQRLSLAMTLSPAP